MVVGAAKWLFNALKFFVWKTLLTISERMEDEPLKLVAETAEDSLSLMEQLAKRAKSRAVRQYYKKQAKLLRCFERDRQGVSTAVTMDQPLRDRSNCANPEAPVRLTLERKTDILSKVTLLINLLLLVAKIVAAIMSGSFSVISSVVDSAVDISSGLIIWLTGRAVRNRDLRVYPRGRTRLEPLALVLISFIMGSASIQLICKSLEGIIVQNIHPNVQLESIVIMALTIVTKFVLWIVCCCYKHPSITILAQDHRNDCLSNTCAIVCAYLGDKYWNYADPLGAIIISFYLLGSWISTGIEQISIISGKAASPLVISRIIRVCLDHSPILQHIETVFAYHFGHKYLVEVHIVLDQNTSLKEAHDVGEPLQQKIESLPFVERAFVHVDYEYCHRPEWEHKVV